MGCCCRAHFGTLNSDSTPVAALEHSIQDSFFFTSAIAACKIEAEGASVDFFRSAGIFFSFFFLKQEKRSVEDHLSMEWTGHCLQGEGDQAPPKEIPFRLTV